MIDCNNQFMYNEEKCKKCTTAEICTEYKAFKQGKIRSLNEILDIAEELNLKDNLEFISIMSAYYKRVGI